MGVSAHVTYVDSSSSLLSRARTFNVLFSALEKIWNF